MTYYSGGSDSYGSTDTLGANKIFGGKVVVSSGTTIVSIQFKLQTAGDRDIRVALYEECADGVACSKLDTGCTIGGGSLTTGWNSCTISYVITSPATYVILVDQNSNGSTDSVLYQNASSGSWYWDSSFAYAEFPPADTTFSIPGSMGTGAVGAYAITSQ